MVAFVSLLALLLSGVLTPAFRGSNAYKSISGESLVMNASVMPLATALEKTGAFDLIVSSVGESPALTNPRALLLILSLVTSLQSQAISSTATSLLLAPLALELAERLGFSPCLLLIGVALAASTSFSAPVASLKML